MVTAKELLEEFNESIDSAIKAYEVRKANSTNRRESAECITRVTELATLRARLKDLNFDCEV